MQRTGIARPAPTGLSFEIADLLVVRAWAEYHDLRMTIGLDYYTGADEFEEVLEFYDSSSGFRRWMIWRGDDGIVVQPMVGRSMQFAMLSDALEHLVPRED